MSCSGFRGRGDQAARFAGTFMTSMPHQGLGRRLKGTNQVCATGVYRLGAVGIRKPGERQVRFREESTKPWQAPVGCGCHAD